MIRSKEDSSLLKCDYGLSKKNSLNMRDVNLEPTIELFLPFDMLLGLKFVRSPKRSRKLI